MRARAPLALLLAVVAGACAPAPQPLRTAPHPPPADPAPCAWFADTAGDVLYFGESPFWSLHAHSGAAVGEALARAVRAAPAARRRIGRFDLARRAWLPPLEAGRGGSGTWDVLAHDNGRVYFTDLFGLSGWIDPASGRSALFPEAGPGLNELVALPDGDLLATRYAGPQGAGSVVRLDPEGAVRAEHPLGPAPGGLRPAAKSLAYDPVREVVWVNTDLLRADGSAAGSDARVLALASGRELRRIAVPELQFVRFAPDGTGRFAWRDGALLWLRTTAPGRARGPRSGRAVLLDGAFPAELDFVQEIRELADGGAIATRWSGIVHVVDGAGAVRTRRLPRPEPRGLFYTAVPARPDAARDPLPLCATFCGAAPAVVCTVP